MIAMQKHHQDPENVCRSGLLDLNQSFERGIQIGAASERERIRVLLTSAHARLDPVGAVRAALYPAEDRSERESA